MSWASTAARSNRNPSTPRSARRSSDHHEVLGDRRRDVEVVAAAGRLDVRAVGAQPVERGVVEAPLAVRRAGGVDLGGVVEHDVEPDLDVVAVGGGDEGGELGRRRHRPPRTGARRRRTRAACSPSSCPPAGSFWCTGISSSTDTPRAARRGNWSTSAAKVPGSATSASCVRPRTWASYTTWPRLRRPRRARRRRAAGDGERAASGVVDAAPLGQRPVVAGREQHLGAPTDRGAPSTGRTADRRRRRRARNGRPPGPRRRTRRRPAHSRRPTELARRGRTRRGSPPSPPAPAPASGITGRGRARCASRAIVGDRRPSRSRRRRPWPALRATRRRARMPTAPTPPRTGRPGGPCPPPSPA